MTRRLLSVGVLMGLLFTLSSCYTPIDCNFRIEDGCTVTSREPTPPDPAQSRRAGAAIRAVLSRLAGRPAQTRTLTLTDAEPGDTVTLADGALALVLHRLP